MHELTQGQMCEDIPPTFKYFMQNFVKVHTRKSHDDEYQAKTSQDRGAGIQSNSTRFVVKPEGGQQCIFDNILGVNENLGVERHQRGLTPDKSSPAV